ncbi:hypothetical protein G7046_g3597 [Stylonectria norvegica]|nr:hypothetical protein G7046_g3597 [Stylonectria norvegica]
MLHCFLLGLSLAGLALAQRTVFNCAIFWPSLVPGDAYTIDANCRMYPGYPITVGQTRVTVVYTEGWVGNLGIIDALLHEAIVQSVALYGTLVPPPDFVIILGETSNEDAALDALMPTFPEGPCQIRSFEGWAMDEALVMTPGVMQAVAHEIYHCVQHKMLGNPPTNTASLWVIESSAHYFSNLVFSKANREWDAAIEYNPAAPIWEQTFEASLFFQSLELSRGMVYLHQFVMSTIFTSSPGEERARLASIPGFADDFFFFARDFSFNRIMDTGGGKIPVQNLPERQNVIWSVNADETEGTAVLETVPFTISQFTMDFDPGQNVKIYSNARGSQRIGWRLRSDTYWHEVPNTASSGGSEGVIIIPCASGPTTIRVLLISTEDKDTDKVELSYVQQYKDENCCKKGSRRRAAGLSACSTASSAVSTTSEPEPTNSGSGSCAGSRIALDPCLSGNGWSLDIPTTRDLIKKQFALVSELEIVNLQVSGAGGLTFDKGKFTFTYTGLTTDIDATTADIPISVRVTLDGKAAGMIFIKSGGSGSGTACLAYTSGSGTITTSSPFTGEQTIDFTPGGGSIEDMDVEYTCGGGRLTIASSASQNPLGGGGPSWGPFAYNAV